MNPEIRDEEPVREFRLEGYGLVLVAAAAVVALAVAFWFGRLYERRYGTEGGYAESAGMETGSAGEGAGSGEFSEISAEDGLTYFDTMEGEGKEAEPGREARPDPAPPAAGIEPEAPEPAAPAGPYFVQVFAGRDRDSAERLIARLSQGGYPVRMHTVKERQSSLYKVLVGGYAAREEAVPVVDALKKDGFAGAWITKIDGD
jgi:hypothetical protein